MLILNAGSFTVIYGKSEMCITDFGSMNREMRATLAKNKEEEKLIGEIKGGSLHS